MTCNFLTFLGEYVNIFPELLLSIVALIALLLSLTPARHSMKSVYGVLFGALFAFLISVRYFMNFPSFLESPVLGGMFHPHVGHDLTRLGIMGLTIILAWMSKRASQLREGFSIEYYGIMFAASVAFMLAVQASNFVALFVALEVGSLLMVLLMSLPKAEGLRSGLSYLLQSSFTTIFFLWGSALIYAHAGSLDYGVLRQILFDSDSLWLLVGVSFILVSICFKLSLFPFTYWTIPVYKGLRLPALGYVATVSKLAGVVVLADLLMYAFSGCWEQISGLLLTVVIISLVWSAISAMHQREFRQLFALSGGVHAAFAICGVLFCLLNSASANAIYFYLLSYFSALLLALYCLLEINPRDFSFDSLRSCYARHPGFSMMLVLALASMAGLPPLVGFIAKFLMIFNAIEFSQWSLLAAMIIASVLGMCYYVSAIFNLVGRTNDINHVSMPPMLRNVPFSTRVICGILMMVILVMGLFQGSMSLLW